MAFVDGDSDEYYDDDDDDDDEPCCPYHARLRHGHHHHYYGRDDDDEGYVIQGPPRHSSRSRSRVSNPGDKYQFSCECGPDLSGLYRGKRTRKTPVSHYYTSGQYTLYFAANAIYILRVIVSDYKMSVS